MEFIAAIGAVLVGLAVGGLSGYFGWRIISSSKIESARQDAQKMLDGKYRFFVEKSSSGFFSRKISQLFCQ